MTKQTFLWWERKIWLRRLWQMVGIMGGLILVLAGCGMGGVAATSVDKKVPTPTQRTVLQTTQKTQDGKMVIQFTITPNRLGTNMFVVKVQNASSGKPETNEQAQIFATMLDMDMGTGVVLLQPDGKGGYSAPGTLPMDGNWDFHIQLLDATGTAVHIAKFKVHVVA
jgi:copper transport protein